jgi:hypothetical protein
VIVAGNELVLHGVRSPLDADMVGHSLRPG